MHPSEIIAIVALVLVIGGALSYIIRAKKKGQKCIGCPYSAECSKRCACKEKENEKQ